MAVSWPAGVNTDAYGMDASPGDNIEFIEFESGKTRTYRKNGAGKKVFSFMLQMVDEGTGSEYHLFLDWWTNTLFDGSLSFYFPDLITHSGLTEYRPRGTFSVTGQRYKELTLEVEEM